MQFSKILLLLFRHEYISIPYRSHLPASEGYEAQKNAYPGSKDVWTMKDNVSTIYRSPGQTPGLFYLPLISENHDT